MRTAGYTRAVTVTGVFNVVASGLATVLLVPGFVRLVGTDTYGIWSLLSLFVAVSAFVEAGMARAMVYFVARSPGDARTFLRRSLRAVSVAYAILAIAVTGLQSCGISVLGGILSGRPAEETWVIGAGLVVTALQAVTTLFRGVLEGNDAADRNNIGFACLTVGQYVAVTLVAWQTHDVRSLLGASVIVYAMILVLHVRWAWPFLAGARGEPAVSGRTFHWFARRAFASDFLALVFAPLVMLLVARAAQGPAQYAIFDISVRIASMAASLVALIGLPVFAYSARAAAGDVTRVRIDVTSRVVGSLTLGLLGWACYVLIAPVLLRWAGLRDVAEIHQTSAVLMIGAVLMSAMEPVVRLRLGTASMVDLIPARAATVGCTVLFALALRSLGTLERFSIAMAAGYFGGALILACLLFKKSHAPEVPP
jgi:hypothetical protein